MTDRSCSERIMARIAELSLGTLDLKNVAL